MTQPEPPLSAALEPAKSGTATWLTSNFIYKICSTCVPPLMTTNHLESLKSSLVDVLTVGSWKNIEIDHEKVQLVWRPELSPGFGKPKYVEAVLRGLAESEIIALARRCLTTFPDRSAFGVEDALWWIEAGGQSSLSEVTRLGIADGLDGRRMHPQQDPCSFLGGFARHLGSGFGPPTVGYARDGRLFTEGGGSFDFASILAGTRSAEKRQLPYTHRELLDGFGFRHWPDKRVRLFLEGLVHPTTRQGKEQAEWVAFINSLLAADGHSLVESESISGHPVFTIRRSDRGVAGRPKNLIFGSTGQKPVLGFRDAINNDVVVLEHAEHCLIYDAPISDEGLRWDDLVGWWAKAQGGSLDDGEVRRLLGKRLLAAAGSPAEKRLFAAYFHRWAPVLGARLPALLPQVYLHYDPATIKELYARGQKKRFLLQRMDFLMLLPHRVRVVIEVDGQQHYSTDNSGQSRPSPAIYAETVKGDRDLRLAGYEVYRFSGHELHHAEDATTTVAEFCSRLFRRHSIQT